MPVPDLSRAAPLVIAAIVLAMESGLLVGVVLPGAPQVLGLGLLSRFGVVGFADAVLTVAAATLLGSQLAFLAARRRDPAGFGLLRRRAGPLLTRAEVLVRRYPMGVAVGLLVGLGHVAGAAYEEVRLAVSLVGLPILLVSYLGLRVRRTSQRRLRGTRPGR